MINPPIPLEEVDSFYDQQRTKFKQQYPPHLHEMIDNWFKFESTLMKIVVDTANNQAH
jgi:hypothetical protein